MAPVRDHHRPHQRAPERSRFFMSSDQQSKSSGSRFGRIAIRVIVPVVFAVGLWHVFTNMARFGTVVSESMNPTLQIGDYYVLRVDAYNGDRKPRRGDIVVFDRPGQGTFIKRVIAVAGDEVGIGLGRVWLNGSWLEEPYLKEEPVTERSMATHVPDGHLFVLGDNRNKSEDSRDYGPIPVDNVMGKVTKIMWPLSRTRAFGPIEYE
ncbi:MAG: signal peptidase I [Armatimonadia bacterium]|nr:signal peptidase I [Armatimonadia bacterium]